MANGLGLGRPASVVVLLAFVIAALGLPRVVSDAPRTCAEADQAVEPHLLPHRELEPFLQPSLPAKGAAPPVPPRP